ncbi:hypothetical protein DFH27DRAFT_529090 [Peziza echinospora]|nr:hypothetical protein DFH27DRAFT_529090 [Peziza echinospora]
MPSSSNNTLTPPSSPASPSFLSNLTCGLLSPRNISSGPHSTTTNTRSASNAGNSNTKNLSTLSTSTASGLSKFFSSASSSASSHSKPRSPVLQIGEPVLISGGRDMKRMTLIAIRRDPEGIQAVKDQLKQLEQQGSSRGNEGSLGMGMEYASYGGEGGGGNAHGNGNGGAATAIKVGEIQPELPASTGQQGRPMDADYASNSVFNISTAQAAATTQPTSYTTATTTPASAAR